MEELTKKVESQLKIEISKSAIDKALKKMEVSWKVFCQFPTTGIHQRSSTKKPNTLVLP